jgi:menaquinone-dependent protoporphyrinogen oxidase
LLESNITYQYSHRIPEVINLVRALIVYGTRYGATGETSEVIADVLRQKGLEVKVANAKKEKIRSVSEFELVIVGSGIRMGKWTKEPEKFLEKFQKELVKKKVALFVCCGSSNPLDEEDEKAEVMEDAKRKYLEDKAAKYNISPIALGFFGGIYDFNKMSWVLRKTMSGIKPQLEEAGFKETRSGVYDLRNLGMIRDWAKEIAEMID